jgi:hypothetical protein
MQRKKCEILGCHCDSDEAYYVRISRPVELVCLLSLLLDPEDGGSTFLRNVGKLLPH